MSSVAGPGVAPGLEDYALCNLPFLRVSDYIIQVPYDTWFGV
jgi:hypothetical protein